MRTSSGVRVTSALGVCLLPLGRPGRRSGAWKVPASSRRLWPYWPLFLENAHDLLNADRE